MRKAFFVPTDRGMSFLANVPPSVIRGLVRTYLAELGGAGATEPEIWAEVDPQNHLDQQKRQGAIQQLLMDSLVEHVKARDPKFPTLWREVYRLTKSNDAKHGRLFV